MAQEKEIKIILKGLSLSEFISRIKKHGFEFKNKSDQLDIYFDTQDWYLYENIAALRLRIVNGKDHSFSFKKVFYLPNRADHYYIEEIETKFPFTETLVLKEIFSKLNIPFSKPSFSSGTEITFFLTTHNYFSDQKMSKTRQKFQKDDNEIVIDEVDKVGIIVELECLDDDPHKIVRTFLKDSEWTRSVEGTSYIWLEKVKGLTSHHENLKRFKKDSDWNVWPNEREMYKTL